MSAKLRHADFSAKSIEVGSSLRSTGPSAHFCSSFPSKPRSTPGPAGSVDLDEEERSASEFFVGVGAKKVAPPQRHCSVGEESRALRLCHFGHSGGPITSDVNPYKRFRGIGHSASSWLRLSRRHVGLLEAWRSGSLGAASPQASLLGCACCGVLGPSTGPCSPRAPQPPPAPSPQMCKLGMDAWGAQNAAF